MTGIDLPSISSANSDLRPNLSPSPKTPVSRLEWFYNLPVKGKQLAGLFTSEAISIVGLVGVGALLIVSAGRTQLLRQATSELAVAEINYNSKIDQMKSSLRAQSDNTAIITAAIAHSERQSLPTALQSQVKQILQNEIKANNIEYATLVGKNRQIIVNANADRTGETFDPNNLVSQVLKNPQQIQASQVVSWTELAKELPPLPKGFANKDALIRYTISPVKDPNTGSIVGALVAGDIVNEKLPIVENTLQAFGGGYSAVYLHQSSGKLTLATSLNQGETNDLAQAKPNSPLLDTSVLKTAMATPGKVVTERGVAGTHSYTIAAKAITDATGKPVAVLVRGTPETALNKLLGDSLLVQLVISALTLAIDVCLAILLGRTITQPIKQLQKTAEKFAQGDRQVRAEVVSTDEVGQLAMTFNELAESIVLGDKVLAQQAQRQKAEAERSQSFAEFTSHLYKSLTSEDILNTSMQGLRQLLQVDRAVIYYFREDYQSGTIVAESLDPRWKTTIDYLIDDPFTPDDIERFRAGRVVVCNNTAEAGYKDCHCQILERLQVKANMAVPLLLDNDLLGLVCVHQCSAPRVWEAQEIALLQQATTQTSLALKQAQLMEQLKRARREAERGQQQAIELSRVEQAHQMAELASIEQRRQKEELQHQVLALLQDIEPSTYGDLTVRANVTEGTIGTIADFFNAIVENLRQIVQQVQQTATQVNNSLETDEQAVEQLSLAALRQTDEINRSLDAVLDMTTSIQAVAENARKAATVTHIASRAAETGGKSIDVTVDNIVNLREKVVETARKVQVLGESSKQISKVVSLVQEIALKTNLLAINAGLEATRAGEEGEGFRVVSEQIGQLAKQAVNATHEIEQVLEVIQMGTKEVIDSMEEGKTQVINSTHSILDAKQDLEKIFDVSHQIDKLVQSIFDTTISQAQTSQIVTELMKEIAEISQQTTNSSNQVSNSLRQTVSVAQQLQESVGRFKIEY